MELRIEGMEEFLEKKLRQIVKEELKGISNPKPEPPKGNQYLTPEEAAERLRKSKSWVYQNRAKIPHKKIGGKLLFTEQQLTEWVHNGCPDYSKEQGRNHLKGGK